MSEENKINENKTDRKDEAKKSETFTNQEEVTSTDQLPTETKTSKVGSSFNLKNLIPFQANKEPSYPMEDLGDLITRRHEILHYHENPEIYNPEQYGDTYSDDEYFIFDEDLQKPLKNTRITTKTRILNNSSNSSISPRGSSSRTQPATSSGNGDDDSRNPYLNYKFLKKKERIEAAERGELSSENGNSENDVLWARIQKRSKETKSRLKELFGTKNWKRLVIMICLIIGISILSFIVPFFSHANKFPHKGPEPIWHEHITDYIYPQLSAIRTNMIDNDTPEEAYAGKNRKGEDWDLVFSDEFNAEGRTFYPGMDQFWEAANLHYAATKDLEWYDPDATSTSKGTLNLRMDVMHNHDLFYRSGMLQSWNKLCHTEGILEISARLPGSSLTAGLWPGLWTLGNLARPGYMASTEGVWPYSYDECDAGITANQSSDDGLSQLPGQKLNKCTCQGEDHPNGGKGRGAPEIDLLEGAHSTKVIFGVASQTIQIAPFDIWYQPDYDFIAVHNLSISNQNSFRGTPFQQMVSTLTTINEEWFQHVVDPDDPNIVLDRETNFQKYAVEYLSKTKHKRDAYTRFFLGDVPTVTVEGNAFHPDGNIGWRDMSKEPMSIILNLGLSTAWSQIDWFHINFPVQFEIDYVRIYQPKGKTQLTCDPSDYPTSAYIEAHKNAYMNPNLTSWEAAGYKFPKHKLASGCH